MPEELRVETNFISGDFPPSLSGLENVGKRGHLLLASLQNLGRFSRNVFDNSEIMSLADNPLGPTLPLEWVNLTNLSKFYLFAVVSCATVVSLDSKLILCTSVTSESLDLSESFITALPDAYTNDFTSLGTSIYNSQRIMEGIVFTFHRHYPYLLVNTCTEYLSVAKNLITGFLLPLQYSSSVLGMVNSPVSRSPAASKILTMTFFLQ